MHVVQPTTMQEHPAVVALVPLLLITLVHTMHVATTPHRIITQVTITPVAQLTTLVLHQDIAALLTALVVMVPIIVHQVQNAVHLVSTQVFTTLVAPVQTPVRHPHIAVLIFQLVALVLLTLVFHLQLVLHHTLQVIATNYLIVVPLTPQALALTAHLVVLAVRAAHIPLPMEAVVVVQLSLRVQQPLDHT